MFRSTGRALLAAAILSGLVRAAAFACTGFCGNTNFGTASFAHDTSGSSDSAFGVATLESNTTGSYNTAVGTNAAADNLSGTELTAIGAQALQHGGSGGAN